MKPGKYDRNVQLRCPTCANTQFEYDPDDERETSVVRCVGCGHESTREELIRENSENIHEHVKDIGTEAVQDVAKELRKTLKKAFSGSKNIKIK